MCSVFQCPLPRPSVPVLPAFIVRSPLFYSVLLLPGIRPRNECTLMIALSYTASRLHAFAAQFRTGIRTGCGISVSSSPVSVATMGSASSGAGRRLAATTIEPATTEPGATSPPGISKRVRFRLIHRLVDDHRAFLVATGTPQPLFVRRPGTAVVRPFPPMLADDTPQGLHRPEVSRRPVDVPSRVMGLDRVGASTAVRRVDGLAAGPSWSAERQRADRDRCRIERGGPLLPLAARAGLQDAWGLSGDWK
jgi:hypothetical protein